MHKVDLAVTVFAVTFIGLCFFIHILIELLRVEFFVLWYKHCICSLAYFIISDYCPKQTPE